MQGSKLVVAVAVATVVVVVAAVVLLLLLPQLSRVHQCASNGDVFL
jgi:uncharacterized membrane protein